jgi:tetratricopeptide (TPR) repeat protein
VASCRTILPLVTGPILALVLYAAGAPSPSPALADSPTADGYLSLALLLTVAKDYPGAEKVLRDGMTRFPEEQGFHLALGDVFLARQDETEAFLEYQWELLRAGPDRPTGDLAARRCGQLIRAQPAGRDTAIRTIMNAMGKQEKGVSQAARWNDLLRTRDHFVLRLFAAEAAQIDGKDPEATRAYRSLLVQDPDFIPALVQLSELLKKAGNEDEAEELLSRAQQLDPSHWRVSGPRP